MKANATDLPQPAPVTAPAPAGAVTALYRAHALGLIRLAVVMLGDRPAAEDAVQEAFCGLYRRWHSLADPAKALSYVRSSVINGCRTVLRRRLDADQPGNRQVHHLACAGRARPDPGEQQS